jgi:RNA polymerase sigma-70 factor (ECF subfamily)
VRLKLVSFPRPVCYVVTSTIIFCQEEDGKGEKSTRRILSMDNKPEFAREGESPTSQRLPSDYPGEVQLNAEAALVRQAGRGDIDALSQLYECYIDRIYRYFYKRVRSISEAEALTSEVFACAIEALQGSRCQWQNKPFGSWLHGIAANVVRKYIRESMSAPIIEELDCNASMSEQSDMLETSVQREEQNALWQLIKELSGVEQRALVAGCGYRLSYVEVREWLGRSENACKQSHYRALSELKQKRIRNYRAKEHKEHLEPDCEEAIVHEGFVSHRTYQNVLLQEDDTLPILANCLVLPYIEGAFEHLPWLERNCLLLYADAEFSQADIAEILGLDREAVYDCLVRASRLWLQAYNSLLEGELGISLSSVSASHNEDFSRVKRLIQKAT